MDASFSREIGIFQVMFSFPKNAGPDPLTAQLELVKHGFRRGTVLDGPGVRLKILRSPYPGPALPDSAWYKVPLSIPYTADVCDDNSIAVGSILIDSSALYLDLDRLLLV